MPKVQTLQWSLGSWQEFATHITNQRAALEAFSFPFTNAIAEILGIMIRQISSQNIQTGVITVLEVCYSTGTLALVPDTLRKMLDPASLVNVAYIEQTLIPFVPTLKQFIVTHKVPPTFAPYAGIFKSILMQWISMVLGPRPRDIDVPVTIMQNTKCGCSECRDMVNFFKQDGGEAHSFNRIGATKRKHLETKLQTYGGRNAARWSTIVGSPQGLQVCLRVALWQTADLFVEPLDNKTCSISSKATMEVPSSTGC